MLIQQTGQVFPYLNLIQAPYAINRTTSLALGEASASLQFLEGAVGLKVMEFEFWSVALSAEKLALPLNAYDLANPSLFSYYPLRDFNVQDVINSVHSYKITRPWKEEVFTGDCEVESTNVLRRGKSYERLMTPSDSDFILPVQ